MSSNFVQTIYSVLADCLYGNRKPIALHEPIFKKNELKYVKECLNSGWVSTTGGKFIDLLEKRVAKFTGAKYVVVTGDGTAALHIGMIIVGVKANDEVLVPALTFVATVNAVTYVGAVPHFVDSDEKTLGVNPEKLAEYLEKNTIMKNGSCINKRTKRPIKAIIAMHTFGQPVDLDALLKVCRRFNLVLIEDTAEALGSFYKGKHVGNWGKVATLSFNANKIITTGGGGAILTNNKKLARLARHLITTAKVPHPWRYRHDRVGYNYRMPNVNAAIGYAQIEQLKDFLKKKRKLAKRYEQAFKDVEGVRFFKENKFNKSNYWFNSLLLSKEKARFRDRILKITNNNQIMTRPAWDLMHTLPMYKNCPRMDLSCAEDLTKRIINIPSSSFLA